MWRAWSVLSITTIVFIGIQNAEPAESLTELAEMEEVRVTGEMTGSLTSASPEEAARQKNQVPGGEAPRIFHPGDGRAFYGGMSWSW